MNPNRSGRRFGVPCLTVLVAVTLVSWSAGLAGAQAGTSADGRGQPTTRSAHAQSPQATIVCTPKVNNPHASGHVPYTVNVTGSVTCTAPVVDLSMTMWPNVNGYYVNSKLFSNSAQASLTGNVAVGCPRGATNSYQGFLTGTVKFPPTYFPLTGSYSAGSPDVRVTC